MEEIKTYCFVITYGRTGSTLLQGLLNQLPDVRIFGENQGAFINLIQAYQAFTAANQKSKLPERDNATLPFYGASKYNRSRLNFAFRRLANDIIFNENPDRSLVRERIVGFKEITHIFLKGYSLEAYINGLFDCFGNVKIIFLTRETQDVLASGWWAKNDPTHTREEIDKFHIAMRGIAENRPSDTIVVDYTSLVSSFEEYERIAAFLGVLASREKYCKVLDTPHSYDLRGTTRILLNPPKWLKIIDGTAIRENFLDFWIERSDGGKVQIDGFALPRKDSNAELTVSGDPGCQIIHGLSTSNLQKSYPFNHEAANAGFTISPSEGAKSITLSVFGIALLEIDLNQQHG